MDLFIITGQPGSGKTRLLNQLIRPYPWIVVFGCNGVLRGTKLQPDPFLLSEVLEISKLDAVVLDHLCPPDCLVPAVCDHLYTRRLRALFICLQGDHTAGAQVPLQIRGQAANTYELTCTAYHQGARRVNKPEQE